MFNGHFGKCLGSKVSIHQLRHTRSVAYSVELVLLNKHQIYGGAPKVNCYPDLGWRSLSRLLPIFLSMVHEYAYISNILVNWSI